MTTLLLLPLLTFVAAHNKNNYNVKQIISNNNIKNDINFIISDKKDHLYNEQKKQLKLTESIKQREIKLIKALNGTEILIECLPAEYLVRTHMAPDFESPQLVRKLDWFHDGLLIASFQQDVVTGISEEWWVASTRYELKRPFYQLRIAPIMPIDSGEYKCWLNTDPLFTLEKSFSIINLLVIIKPLPPSKPHINAAISDYTIINDNEALSNGKNIVLVSWNHSVGIAHQPILRYSILISQINDSSSIRILTTENNRTSKLVDGLLQNTQYSFSVRAENTAGNSEFGAETLFKTIVPVPKYAPKIISIKNQTGKNDKTACVEVEWTFGTQKNEQRYNKNINDFKIIVTELLPKKFNKMNNDLSIEKTHRSREWHVKKNKQKSVLLCSLEFNTKFRLSIQANTGFGLSPASTKIFRTSESSPSGPPIKISARVIPPNTIALSWSEPEQPNGQIISYQIYLREKIDSKKYQQYKQKKQNERLALALPPTLIRLLVEPNEKTKLFAYNISKLSSNVIYEIRLSASTHIGESNKSQPIFVQTDRNIPPAPKIIEISYECQNNNNQNSIRIEWTNVALTLNKQSKDENINELTKNKKNINFFYQIQFEDARRKFFLNSTLNWVIIDNLEVEERYLVRVAIFVQSNFDKNYYFQSSFSKAEIFKIDKLKCQFYSSICLSNSFNCKLFVLSKRLSQNTNVISLPLLFLGIIFIILLLIIFTYFLRRNCFFIKNFIKKKKKSNKNKLKNNTETLQHEIESLVQDSTSNEIGETVTINNFYDYCKKLAANDNSGYRRQFQELEECVNQDQTDITPTNTPSSENEFSDTTKAAIKINNNYAKKNRYVNVCALENSRICIRRKNNDNNIKLNCTKSNRNSAESNDPTTINTSITSVQSNDVVLVNGIECDDDGYINANYIDSTDKKNAYIATQAPLPHTFNDFWAMIWQENCSLIIMITNLIENGKRKCDQYWPSTLNSPMILNTNKNNRDNFEVTMNMEHTNTIFTHRIFTLRIQTTKQNFISNETSLSSSITSTLQRKQQTSSPLFSSQYRTIHHLQFILWPDHGVPQSVSPILHFIHYASECYNTCKNSKKSNPIVVHCSAGVGRSGSFILIDSIRRHLMLNDRINIQAHLKRIRMQRAHSVQTLEQYIFCHQVLCQLIRHGNTRQPITNFSNYLHFLFNQYTEFKIDCDNKLTTIKLNIQTQFEDFCECYHTPNCQLNSIKKETILITLPGYHSVDEFLIGRWPTECAELWSTIWQQKCSLVVLLGADAEIGTFFNATAMSLENTLIWTYSAPFEIKNAFNTAKLQKKKFENYLIEMESHPFDSGFSETDVNSNDTNLNNVSSINASYISQSKNLLTANDNLTSSLIQTSLDENDYQIIRLKRGNFLFDVCILRVKPSALESDVWVEIERIQHRLLQCENLLNIQQQQRHSMMILDPRGINNSLPFILCALQSAACQLETEGFVDIPLYLDSYRRAVCGCWTSQSNIEYIYAKIHELIQLKQNCIV